MYVQAKVPYSDLFRLPPQTDIESKAILKACIRQQAAITEDRRTV